MNMVPKTFSEILTNAQIIYGVIMMLALLFLIFFVELPRKKSDKSKKNYE